MSGARKGARGEVRRRGGIAQSPGGSDVKVSSFKEAFDHVVGERGRRLTKGFHEGLTRKVDIQITEIRFRVRLPETP